MEGGGEGVNRSAAASCFQSWLQSRLPILSSSQALVAHRPGGQTTRTLSAHIPAAGGPPVVGAGLVKSRAVSPPSRSPGAPSGAASGAPRRQLSRSALLVGPPGTGGGAGPACECSPSRSTPSSGGLGSCGVAGLSASKINSCSGAFAAGTGVSSSTVSLLSAESVAASSSDSSLSPMSSAGADGVSWAKWLSGPGSPALSSEREECADGRATPMGSGR